MGLISETGRSLCKTFFFLVLFAPLSLHGQDAPILFSTELQSVEKRLASPPGPAEKNRALRDMATLMELSGNIEAAARAWNDAARTLPSDYDALTRSGVCFAAIGEFDNALRILESVFRVSPSGESGLRARYTGVQVEAFRSGETAGLFSLLRDPAFSAYKPGIYYGIWRISGDADCRNRLLAEFPQSPEALALKGGVTIAPTAFWLLGAGLPSSDPSSPGLPSPGLPPSSLPSPSPAPSGTPSGQSAGEDRPSDGPVMLQTGLFGREENARILAGRLRGAGFAPLVTTKTVNGTLYWAVGIAPGKNYTETILLLKDAGFEAFPVY